MLLIICPKDSQDVKIEVNTSGELVVRFLKPKDMMKERWLKWTTIGFPQSFTNRLTWSDFGS